MPATSNLTPRAPAADTLSTPFARRIVAPYPKDREGTEDEVYTIHLPDPHRYRYPGDFQANSSISVLFQRYRRESPNGPFVAVFPEDINLTLRIKELCEKFDYSSTFPYYRLEAYPEVSLYITVKQAALNDPVLWMLTNNLRLVFRYSLEEGVGCLIQASHDWPKADNPSVAPLWRSALNQRRSFPST